ncbi:MAG: hypothetical protein SYR96_21360 [Actinomycetota bacterium]|nr:hypothetical protein [Actinomycetota bacterium]
MSTSPPRPHVHHVEGRTRGTGPVLAVFTDGPTDLTVAATAAAIAAQTGTLLIAAAAVPHSGFSLNSLLHRARSQRISQESAAIIGRVTPILTTAGVAWARATFAVPLGVDPARTLPAHAIQDLINRFAAVTVVTAAAPPGPSSDRQPAPLNDHQTKLDRS